MAAGPLANLHMAAITLCYAVAAWHFVLLVRDVRTEAKNEERAGLTTNQTMSAAFPFGWGDRPYKTRMFYGPQHRHQRRRMYAFAAIGFLLFLLLTPQLVTNAAPL